MSLCVYEKFASVLQKGAEGREGMAPLIFNSALYGGMKLDLGSGRFAPKESDHSII
jgi:hypothetical protein